MRNIAFLSMDNLDDFVSDDELAIPFLNDLGFNVDSISWRKKVDWNKYEMVIIRTTWDYQKHPESFLNVLHEINSSNTILQNNIELIKWNIDKKYLDELDGKGNKIVPTIWENKIEPSGIDRNKLRNYFLQLETDEIIIKPNISANADNTFRIKEDKLNYYEKDLLKIFNKRPFMVQPFVKNIIEEGEYSLFYFNNEYSHTILKKPKQNDFRVQEEHGGVISAVKPNEKLIEIGNIVLNSLSNVPLYSRIDLVRDLNNNFLLMEVELIEPALYFRMDPSAPKKFAEAVIKKINNTSK